MRTSSGRRITAAPVSMTVAGSDSGGGAGIQADLKTFAAFGVFGASAITTLTAQSPLGVSRVDASRPSSVAAQMQSVMSALDVASIKTGMLFSSSIIKTVAKELESFKGGIVVDPVMIATSGAALIKTDAVKALQERLLPVASWITPNIPEAEALCGIRIKSEKDMAKAAMLCSEKWGCSTIVKGGHAKASSEWATDIVCHDRLLMRLNSRRVKLSPHAGHGTGCTFSAALAACLAKGLPYDESLVLAKDFVSAALAAQVRIGKGVFTMRREGVHLSKLGDMAFLEDFR